MLSSTRHPTFREGIFLQKSYLFIIIMSKFVVMSSSSDSEKTTSNQFRTSENAQSSSSSSPSNSNTIIDLETTETSRDNPVDIVDTSEKGK